MVCIYCGNKTTVANSRLQKRRNSVWRRRQCSHCGAVFTSIEQTSYDQSFGFKYTTSHIIPFQRDVLFLSLYEACRHRADPVSDAAALTDTVIRKLSPSFVTEGVVERAVLRNIAAETLLNFDVAAATHYQAYHPA